jgi:hypothetical protein
MAKRDAVKTLKALIIQEIREEHPSFPSIDKLMAALKDAMARQDKIGVEDIAPSQEVETRRSHLVIGNDTSSTNASYITAGSTATITTGGEMMSADQYRQGHGNGASGRRRRENMQDQFLAACDQVAQNVRTQGTIGALAPVLHHLPLLYPSEAMQEAVREAFRQEINRVLAPVFEPENNALPPPEDGMVEQTEAEEEGENPAEEGANT